MPSNCSFMAAAAMRRECGWSHVTPSASASAAVGSGVRRRAGLSIRDDGAPSAPPEALPLMSVALRNGPAFLSGGS
jgi:hypothetical protein